RSPFHVQPRCLPLFSPITSDLESKSSSGPGESGDCSVGTAGPETSAENTTSGLKNKWPLVVDRLTVLFLKFLEYIHKLQLFIWWLLEMHIIKIVSSCIILVSVQEVTLSLFC
uniref:Uncharacterized protein n=1 Tax=Hucho hucho TaxID=62062 RepID=A0A4W5KQU1_9TELE